MLLALVAAAVLGQTPASPDPIAAMVGQKAPGFKLTSSDGKVVDLARQFGRHPVVLVFYRGVW